MTDRIALWTKIEEAIRLASTLGPDAFDFIEGRGLAATRAEIRDELWAADLETAKGREDSARLNWLESNRGGGKGGWQVLPATPGWALRVMTRGPYNSIRKAIDAAIKQQFRDAGTSSAEREPVVAPSNSED